MLTDTIKTWQGTAAASSSKSAAPNLTSSRQQPRIFDVTEGLRSRHTAVGYRRIFKRFLKHIQITDLEVLLDFNQKIIKEMIVDYILWLRNEKKLNRPSIKVHISAILHFFQINNDEFHLTIRNFRLHLPSDEFSYSDDRAYSREEISQILRACDIRSRAMILLLCSSGMRIGALRTLQVGDLTKVDDTNQPVYLIKVYARTRDKYTTICTPECYSAIEDYLRYRQNSSEQLSAKAPLFREQFNVDDKIRINAPRFLGESTIGYLISKVIKRSGVECKDVQMTHGFRKHFMTECEKSGMKSINVKMLLGHDIGVSGHYYRPTDNELVDDYLAHAVDTLTISNEHRIKKQLQQQQDVFHSKEWINLRQDMNQLKEILDSLTANDE